jgi:hypothetical protein
MDQNNITIIEYEPMPLVGLFIGPFSTGVFVKIEQSTEGDYLLGTERYIVYFGTDIYTSNYDGLAPWIQFESLEQALDTYQMVFSPLLPPTNELEGSTL